MTELELNWDRPILTANVAGRPNSWASYRALTLSMAMADAADQFGFGPMTMDPWPWVKTVQ